MTSRSRTVAEIVPTEAAAAAAFEIDQRVRLNLKAMRGMWVQLAQDLHRFNRSELWRDLGHDSFERWLMDPGLELERRWTYNLIATYEQLVVQRGVEPARLAELQVSKVGEVLPAVRRGQVSVDEALEDAAQLRRPDLELKYRGAGADGVSAGPDTGTAVRTEREPVWKTCPHCGSTYQARPEE